MPQETGYVALFQATAKEMGICFSVGNILLRYPAVGQADPALKNSLPALIIKGSFF